MSATIISGKEVSKQIRAELTEEVAALTEKTGKAPGLAVVLIGDDGGSVSYVKAKEKACAGIGIESFAFKYSSITEGELLELIDKLNKDPKVNGILVQLPLPKDIDANKVLYAIDPNKDVDGFHPVNVGRLMIGESMFPPCTPAGIQELIIRSGTETSGAEVVVVGRSNIVGKPITMMMGQKAIGANATVTMCHTRTQDMDFHTKRADILIVAAGVPNYIKGSQIKPGACVIDVGVNRIGMTESGKAKLAGDVDFAEATEVAGCITPVPGGVGPMTIAMLMRNTVRSFKRANNLPLE